MKKLSAYIMLLGLLTILSIALWYGMKAFSYKTESDVITAKKQQALAKTDGNTVSEIITENKEELTDTEEEIISAHASLLSHFGEAKSGLIYPEDYCGDYQKDDKLHIVLTSLDDETVAKYNEYVKNSGIVVYEQGGLSLGVMESYRDEMWKALENASIQPYCGYVDQMTGIIRIEVSPENVDSAREYIESLILTGEYEGVESDDVEVRGGACSQATTTTLYGGSKLYRNGNPNRTLGISGTISNATAFVTCGHDTSSYAQFTGSSGNLYGTAILVRYHDGGYGDFSICAAGSDCVGTGNVFAVNQSMVNVCNYLDFPVLNSSIKRYGYQTGETSCIVEATNATVNTDTGITIYGMCLAKTFEYSVGGDSGGPYRQGSYFLGVHHGNGVNDDETLYEDEDGYYRVIFTPNYYMRTCSYHFYTYGN